MDHASEARRLIAAAADLTLADVMRTQAVVRPRADALVADAVTLSYGELDARTERIASGLLGIGLRRGDRLAVLSRNSLEYALLFHSAAKAGIAIAALNWRSAPAELARAVALVEPAAVAVSGELRGVADEVAPSLRKVLLDRPAEDGAVAFAELEKSQPVPLEARAEDIVSIVFTSGTTGDPKAVAISQRALIARAGVIGVDWSLEASDAFVGWAPLFHISSSDYLFTTTVLSGVFVVVDGFDAEKIAAIVRERKIGWLFLVPGTFEKMIEALGEAPLPPGQVKVVGVMADLAPPAVIEKLSEMTGAPFLNSFGMTETGLLPCSPSFVRSRDEAELTLPKKQSALASIRLVGEDGSDVAEGEPGEMWVRSQTVASGYWNNDEATCRAYAGGWYHTGDVMRRRPDGTLQFVGRLSGMIKSGGENIYPAEIERALLSHPDVTEAAAIGMAHPRWGETPLAFVSLAEGARCGADELKAHLAGLIASYKIPGEIRVIGLSDFPRNVTGKVDRKALMGRFADGLAR